MLRIQDHDPILPNLVSGLVLVWGKLLHKYNKFTVLQVGLLKTPTNQQKDSTWTKINEILYMYTSLEHIINSIH